MTHAPADIGLSPDAAGRFDDYLRQTHAALAGSSDVNPDEIEADIREHVERELLGAPRPVPLAALDAVLARLGSPSQWGAGDGPTLWQRAARVLREAQATAVARARRVRFTLWNGPNDWRLAYLSFGVFALGILTFGALLPVCLPVSYLLSRAGLAHARERGLDLGAGRKWLLYPPVVLVSAALLVAALAVPIVVGAVVAEQIKQADPKLRGTIPVAPALAPAAGGLFVGAGAALVWGAALGAAAASYPGAVRATFRPLCDTLQLRLFARLPIPCFALLIPWTVAAYEFIAALM